MARKPIQHNRGHRQRRRMNGRQANRPVFIGLQLDPVDIHHHGQQTRDHHHQKDRPDTEQRCLLQREGVVEQRKADEQRDRGQQNIKAQNNGPFCGARQRAEKVIHVCSRSVVDPRFPYGSALAHSAQA